MFWHGGGIVGGWGDDAGMTTIQDYLMHYLDLLDQLKIARFSLVGLSLGGWMASTFATQHADKLNKLVLVAPVGLWVKEHPTTDLFRLKPEELAPALTENLTVLGPLPDAHDVNAIVESYREFTTLARIAWQRPTGPN
jgi:pimeloyl-ACP methyl ester carboxylesterase